jgi:hypothetical protein
MHTVDGRRVEIETRKKERMSVFVVYGTIDGKPCHWTASGRFRMDGKDDPRDIAHFQ